MKIGFLAMSGIRAHDQKLLEYGLTLPGFVDRSKVIASLPSLGLLYLAACTPAGHDIAYYEAEADLKEPAAVYGCDLVAISTFSAQIFEAYAIADRLRTAGVKVAMGGLHVSVLPDEAAAHADYVIVGEGEHVWPAVVAAAMNDEPARRFSSRDAVASLTLRGAATSAQADVLLSASPAAVTQSSSSDTATPRSTHDAETKLPLLGSRTQHSSRDSFALDVSELPVPRYDLLVGRAYNRFTVQTSRGCPWRCDFCASNVMLGHKYRKRPVEHVIRDIRAIMSLFPKPFIEFADDNTFVDKEWGKELCRQLAPLHLKWFTETDISVADDPELLDLMRIAGCRQVLIGLESPGQSALEGMELHNNFKARRAGRYEEAVRTIQSHGITVNGCFILGLDRHDTGIFQEVLDFAMRVSLFDVQITLLTAFPGTPLYDRLLREGRILFPGRWELCTLFDVNFQPAKMSPQELRDGLYWLGGQLYSKECTERRRAGFFRNRSQAARAERTAGLSVV